MTSTISNLGRQLALNNGLITQQNSLALLNAQLASGVKSSSLTDYTPVEARQLLDFQNNIAQRQSYIASMTVVQNRISVYDTTLSDMEKLTSQAQSLASQNLTYNSNTAANITAQADSYLSQITDDLNQKLGDRYLYAGTRYNTLPVTDLTALSGAPSATPTTGTNLPVYDTNYAAPGPTSNANAFTKDSVLIDTSYNVSYGVTSTDPSIQKMIAGMRFMKAAVAAGQGGDTAGYQSNMQQASTLLTAALSGIQTVHAGVASAQNTLTNETETQKTNITNLQNQITDIQSVDLTTVGTQINLLQSQMQASYSATASFEQLSLVKYL